MNTKGIGRRAVLQGAGATTVLLATPTVLRAQDVIRLTFATGFPPALPWVKEATETFLPAVNEELAKTGSYRIEWTQALSGTLARVNAMLTATTDNLCDVALLAPIFEPTNMPLDNIGFVTPFTVQTPGMAAQVVNAMHAEFPAMRETWERHNVVHLGSIANDPYSIVTKFPFHSLDDLEGRKISGAGMNLPWITATGATAVGTNFATLYNDMAAGVFEGVCTFPYASSSIALQELCKHVALTEIGCVSTLAFAANRDRYRSLPEEVQAAMVTAGQRSVESYDDRIAGLYQQALDVYRSAGAEIVTLGREVNKAWADRLPPLAGEWAESLEGRGIDGAGAVEFYISYLRRNDVEILRDWTQG